MKRILYIISIIASVSLVFTGCEKDITTEDTSRITYFANFTVEGEDVVMHPLGTAYTDGAVTAEEDGTSLDVNVTVSGETSGYTANTATIDSDVMDKYIINYTATNSDGYDGGVSRTVIVGSSSDMVTSIEGVYYGNSQREPAFAVTAQYTDMEYIFIKKTGDNTYELTDALGGYYYIGRDYGFGYAAQGAIITANDIAANDFTITQAVFPIWGNTVDITDFSVDAATKTISFTGTGNFGNGEFHVQLKQVEF
jgi:hypothetical protein